MKRCFDVVLLLLHQIVMCGAAAQLFYFADSPLSFRVFSLIESQMYCKFVEKKDAEFLLISYDTMLLAFLNNMIPMFLLVSIENIVEHLECVLQGSFKAISKIGI